MPERFERGDRVLDPADRSKTAVIVDGPQTINGNRWWEVHSSDGEEMLYQSLIDMVREYVTPKTILETSGGDSSTGEFIAPPAGAQGAVFTPIPPPRMPPKDEQ